MTNENQITPDDPRFAFAMVTEAVGALMEAAEAKGPDTLGAPTPCPDFNVEQLLDHVVMVMRRVAVMGAGGHFSTIQQDELGGDWTKAYRASAHDIMEAWTDAEKLGQMFEVPWGQMPGGPLLYSYAAELAVHGWDLATAGDLPFAIDDQYLHGALEAARFIPAEGREDPDMPFGSVVDPGPDVPVLLTLAGWMGRAVAVPPAEA